MPPAFNGVVVRSDDLSNLRIAEPKQKQNGHANQIRRRHGRAGQRGAGGGMALFLADGTIKLLIVPKLSRIFIPERLPAVGAKRAVFVDGPQYEILTSRRVKKIRFQAACNKNRTQVSHFGMRDIGPEKRLQSLFFAEISMFFHIDSIFHNFWKV